MQVYEGWCEAGRGALLTGPIMCCLTGPLIMPRLMMFMFVFTMAADAGRGQGVISSHGQQKKSKDSICFQFLKYISLTIEETSEVIKK